MKRINNLEGFSLVRGVKERKGRTKRCNQSLFGNIYSRSPCELCFLFYLVSLLFLLGDIDVF
jgi:hypothetical protein